MSFPLPLSSLHHQLQQIQYTLLMKTPQLKHLSLTQHLCLEHYLSEDKKLFTKLLESSRKVCMRVLCPNLFIQKVRSLYYLFLKKTYERKDEKFQRAFLTICLNFYQNKEVQVREKKFLAEFLQFMSYEEERLGFIQEILNKYPIMDEILIDMIIEEIQHKQAHNKHGSVSADDNYNIVQFLRRLDLRCEARTLWEIRLQGYEIRVSSESMMITTLEGEKQKLIDDDHYSTDEISMEDDEDINYSNVVLFCEAGLGLEGSYIDMLKSLIAEEEQNQSSKSKSKGKLISSILNSPTKKSFIDSDELNNDSLGDPFSRKQKISLKEILPLIKKKTSMKIEPTVRGVEPSERSVKVLKYRSSLKIISPNSIEEKNEKLVDEREQSHPQSRVEEVNK